MERTRKKRQKNRELLLKIAERLLGKDFYINTRTAAEIQTLYPGKEGRIRLREFWEKKLRKTLMVFLLVLVLIPLFGMAQTGVFIREGEILRNDYGKQKKSVAVIAETAEGAQEVDIEVSSRSYTKQEAKSRLQEEKGKMDGYILGKNNSLDHVDSNLNLLKSITPGPIKVRWSVEKPELMNTSGKLLETDVSEAGEAFSINAVLSYEDQEEYYHRVITVFPAPMSEDQRFINDLKKLVQKEDQEQKTENTLTLPESIGEKELRWREEKRQIWIPMALLGVILAIGIYINEDKQLSAAIRKREKEMKEDYPEILDKLVLLMGAGMTVRGAWERIVADYCRYSKRKRYAYEEMALCTNEMKSGISEHDAYEHFGRRCGTAQYMKLSSLLTQNLKKGAKGILDIFRRESEESMEKRKNDARKRGEEAGTKLLIPMVMMLGVVLIIVMVPAFRTMQM